MSAAPSTQPDDSAAWQALAASSLPTILFVSHALGGGVARHIDELAEGLQGHAEVVLLQPAGEEAVQLRWLTGASKNALALKCADWDALVEWLRGLGIDRVHLHHVHGLPQAILELPRQLGCPHDVTLHDFFPACAEYHFMGPGRFCGGQPDCRRCTEREPAQWPLDVDAWRAAFAPFLAAANRVIAPSADAAGRIRRFFPAIAPVVWPHASGHEPVPRDYLRVLVPGAISGTKGIDLLEACIRDAIDRRLPMHFRVVGLISRPLPAWPQAPFSLTGEYPEHRLAELLAIERGHVVLFASQCPETFSYTLSSALATPLPIVAVNLGALPERLAQRANATLVRWDASAAEVNDALIATAAKGPVGVSEPGKSAAAYASRYVEGIERGVRHPATASANPPWIAAEATQAADTTLEWLYQDGVVCGRAASRERLLKAAIDIQGRLDGAMKRLAESWQLIDDKERQRWAHEQEATTLRGELNLLAAETQAQRERLLELHDQMQRAIDRAGAAESRIREIEASTSWRITAPVRFVSRKIRGGG